MEQINSLLPALASAKGLPAALSKCREALRFLRNADLSIERRLAVERAACVAVGRAREGNMVCLPVPADLQTIANNGL
jgi:hypothetical protein